MIMFLLCVLSVAGTARAWPARVVHIADGDSLTVVPWSEAESPVKLRLYGIDAPEFRQAYGREATNVLRSLLDMREPVEISPMATDRHGRVVAVVSQNERLVNADMVKLGAAWVDKRHCKTPVCASWLQAARSAKAAKRGLWAKKATPPWAWRAAHPRKD